MTRFEIMDVISSDCDVVDVTGTVGIVTRADTKWRAPEFIVQNLNSIYREIAHSDLHPVTPVTAAHLIARVRYVMHRTVNSVRYHTVITV